MITEEDFAAWLENPVTQAVLAAVAQLGSGAKQEWLEASWNGGTVDPVFLAGLKAKEQVARDLVEMTYEDFTTWKKEQ